MPERGVIYNRARATQVIDFSGLRYGTITPTDIDGFTDFHNKMFVWVELKHDAAPLPFGQKLALERATDACERGGVPSYLIVARHNEPEHNDINAASCVVTQVYHVGRWKDISIPITVRDAMDKLREKHGIQE